MGPEEPQRYQEFPCKEPGCHATAKYEQRFVLGVVEAAQDGPVERRPSVKTVYLTCTDGHYHPYEVTVYV